MEKEALVYGCLGGGAWRTRRPGGRRDEHTLIKKAFKRLMLSARTNGVWDGKLASALPPRFRG